MQVAEQAEIETIMVELVRRTSVLRPPAKLDSSSASSMADSSALKFLDDEEEEDSDGDGHSSNGSSDKAKKKKKKGQKSKYGELNSSSSTSDSKSQCAVQ